MAEKSDDEILKTARKRHQHAVEYYADDRKYQQDDRRFYVGSPDNGYHWPEAIRSKREAANRPMITINKLPQHVKQVTNEQRQNRPQIKVLPVDDKADPETAKVFNGVIRNIENVSVASVAYDTATENQTASGLGYVRLLTDYVDDMSFDQDIQIVAVEDPDTIDMDPDHKSPWGIDAQWCFVSSVISEDEYTATWPNAKPIDWQAENVRDDKWHADNKRVRIAEYFYIEYDEYDLYWFDVNGQAVIGSKETLPPEVLLLKPTKTRKVRKPLVRWCKLNGQEVLEKREWAGRFIPIVKVIGNCFVVDGKRLIFGHIRNTKDAQRMYNYWTTLEAEAYALMPKAPWVIAEGQIEGHETEWANANLENQPYLTYKPTTVEGLVVPPPQRQAPIMPNTGLLQAKLGAAEDLKGTTSQYNASLGQPSNEKSGIAIRERKVEGDLANFHYIDNFATALRYLGMMLVDLIPKIIDTERVIRIMGEDGEPDYVKIRPGLEQEGRKVASMPVKDPQSGEEIGRIYDPSVGRYDVVVSVGPSYTTQRQEAADMLIQLSQGATDPQLALVMRYLAVKNMDWSGASELVDIMKRMLPPNIAEDGGKEDARTKQLVTVIEQLQGELQRVQQSFEAQKSKNDEMRTLFDGVKASVAGYQAETARMKELLPFTTPEGIMELVARQFPHLMTPQPEMRPNL